MPIPFDPAISGFDRQNALYLAHAADIAYHRKPGPAALDRLGLLTIHPFRHKLTRTRGFLGICSTHAVLAFRGTEPANLANWITDSLFSLAAKSDYDGKVHAGFSGALKSTWQKISAVLPHAAHLPLFLTGHSMGGALAKLTACRLARLGTPAVATYTFGAPRFGDTVFCSTYRLPTYRVVNKMDLVPEIPLAGFKKFIPTHAKWADEKVLARLHQFVDRLPAYGHVKTLIHIDDHNEISIDPDLQRWHAAVVARAIASKGKPFVAGIQDHLIDNYIKSLDQCVTPPLLS